MSGYGKQKVSKMESKYIQQHELTAESDSIRRKKLYRRLTVFGILAGTILFFMVSTMISQSSALEKKQTEKQELELKLAALEKKEVILQEEIIKLNDDEYIAKLARRDYFLSDKNEIIFNLPEKDLEETSEESSY